jgi:CHASE3 domain sensor protein
VNAPDNGLRRLANLAVDRPAEVTAQDRLDAAEILNDSAIEEVATYLAVLRREEREACAKIVSARDDAGCDHYGDGACGCTAELYDLAAKIRERATPRSAATGFPSGSPGPVRRR